MKPTEGIRRVFDAFGGGGVATLFEVIADDAVWTINGTVPFTRVYEGRDRILELFRETRRLTDGTYRSDLKWSIADAAHAVAVYRATGRRLGRELDIDQLLLIDHDSGVWRRISAVPTNPAAFEWFWA